MAVKIVTDSSSNLISREEMNLSVVPLTIQAGEKSYRDDGCVNVEEMLQYLSGYKGHTSTACPAPGDWIDAFEGADTVIGTTITSNLSGCYNSAQVASQIYEREHPGRQVFILDSLSTGPELELQMDKLAEMAEKGMSFETMKNALIEYSRRTGLMFMLSTLDNFVKSGRVSVALAKLVDILNIRIVGQASAQGDLEPMNKCRGDKGGLQQLWKNLKKAGYIGGKLRIGHTKAEKLAVELKNLALKEFPSADIRICANRALCAYYAQEGGIIVGYERA